MPVIRFLRLRDVKTIVGLSDASIYRLIGEGKFPKPTKVGPHASRWVESEVVAWMEERLADRETPRHPNYARRTFAESVAQSGKPAPKKAPATKTVAA